MSWLQRDWDLNTAKVWTSKSTVWKHDLTIKGLRLQKMFLGLRLVPSLKACPDYKGIETKWGLYLPTISEIGLKACPDYKGIETWNFRITEVSDSPRLKEWPDYKGIETPSTSVIPLLLTTVWKSDLTIKGLRDVWGDIFPSMLLLKHKSLSSHCEGVFFTPVAISALTTKQRKL